MKATGIIRRFDELGRINVSKEIRIKLFGTKDTDGEAMEIFMDGEDVIFRKYEENKDDVCEWKKCSSVHDDFYVYSSKCFTKNLKEIGTTTHIIYDWKYCPYCGKKIKVVE